MNKHIKFKMCVVIGGKYYHNPQQAAKAWANRAFGRVWKIYHDMDVDRFDKRFSIMKAPNKNWKHYFGTGPVDFRKWELALEKKAYRRAFPIFKRALQGNNEV